MKMFLTLVAWIACSATAVAGTPAALVRVSGDRQIVAAEQRLPAPIVSRVVDGSGLPLENVPVITGPLAAWDLGPRARDEFGFYGFNVIPNLVDYGIDFPPPQLSLSKADGTVSGLTDWGGVSPSAYVLGAVVVEGTRNSTVVPQILYSIVRVRHEPVGAPVVAVEYFNRGVGHYFLTSSDAEVAALDSGKFAGWERSIGSIPVYPDGASAPAGAVPVCRFFSSQFTTHFYSADRDECDAVQARWPDVWQLETRAAFYVMPLDDQGKCPATYQPVSRLYASRNGPNHRYVTDRTLQYVMAANGWLEEGRGPATAVFCVNG